MKSSEQPMSISVPTTKGALQGVDLDDIDLNVHHQGVLVEVPRQFGDVAVQDADVDQGPQDRELRLLEEVLDLDGHGRALTERPQRQAA